ncbi:hypothetical protein [Soonwooa buanensis]|nr:hypothetical protein [Soonwooa buanensis]
MIEKIWKDPVWSKVISVIIVAIGGLILAKAKSYYDSQTFKEAFNDIINYQLKIIYIFFGIIIFWILRWIYKISLGSNRNKTNSKFEKNKTLLRKVDKIIDKKEGVMMKWNVHFSTANKPFVSDVNCFCLLHGDLPIKFLWNRCPHQDCKNSQKQIDDYSLENLAESIVLDEWDKINGNKII